MTGCWRREMLLLGVILAAGCATRHGRPVDKQIVELSEAGQAAYAAGLPSKAVALYSQALVRSRLLDEPLEAARNAYNLGLCRMAMGEYPEARRMLEQARILLEPDGAELGKVLVACAELDVRSGNAESARALSERVMEVCREKTVRCQAAILLGELDARAGNLPASKKHYVAAQEACDWQDLPPALGARMAGLMADLTEAGVLHGDRAVLLLKKAGCLQKAGSYRDMAQALGAAGDAFAATGRRAAAFGSYERAAYSLHAAGDRNAALDMVGRMRVTALEMKDGAYQERLAVADQAIGSKPEERAQ